MSKSTIFLIGGILIAVIVVGGALLLVNKPANSNTSTTTSNPTSTVTPTNTGSTSTSQSLTASFVATKTTKNDCYVIYESGVYKVPTSWFGEHPGGSQEILRFCGKDMTSAFNSNPEHRSDAQAMLESFYVGELVQ